MSDLPSLDTGEVESHLLGGLLAPSSTSTNHAYEAEPGWPVYEEKTNGSASIHQNYHRQQPVQQVRTPVQEKKNDLAEERDVLVIAVVGCTNAIGGHNVTNNLFHHIPFSGTPPLDPFQKWRKDGHVKGEETLLQITECPNAGTIYIQLSDIGDMSLLGRVLDRLETLNKGKGAGKHEFHHWLTSVESIHVKSLLFVFLCAHHILILGPRAGRIDIGWCKLFPLLQKAKVRLQEPITQMLLSQLPHFTDPVELVRRAMPANFVPVVTFGLPCPHDRELPRDRRRSRGGHNSPRPRERLDQRGSAAERQRLRTDKQVMNILRRCCPNMYSENLGEDRSGNQTLMSTVRGRTVFWLPAMAPTAQEFLFQQDREHGKMFEKSMKNMRDEVIKKTVNIVRRAMTATRSLPSREDWTRGAMLVYDALTLRPEEREKREKDHPLYLDTAVIESYKLDTIGAYSALTCERVIPGCHKIYQDRLPTVYSEKLHKARMKKAADYLKSNSVGPCQPAYVENLEKILKTYWEDGRQACNAVSLTGRPCVYRLHSLPGQKSLPCAKGDEGATAKHHSTGFNNRHACSCGKTQYQRGDPFDLEEANERFYKRDCCRQYVSYNLSDAGTSTGFGLVRLGEGFQYRSSVGLTLALQKGFKVSKKFLLPWDLPIGVTIQSSIAAFNQVAQQERRMKNHGSYAAKIAQHSLNKGAVDPDGLLGKWLHQSRQFLKSEVGKQVPRKLSSPSKTSKRADLNQQVGVPIADLHNREYLRCYVGLEFECFRGHRFILGYKQLLHLAGMDYNLAGPNGGVPKGTKICWREFPPCDVPLSLQCGCGESKSGSSVVAQLQRLIVRTPPIPLSITAHPKIQSHRAEERFELPTRGGVVLPPDSLVLLRFPYILYSMENKRGVPPDKCRLLKGALQVHGLYSTKSHQSSSSKRSSSLMNSRISRRSADTRTTANQARYTVKKRSGARTTTDTSYGRTSSRKRPT